MPSSVASTRSPPGWMASDAEIPVAGGLPAADQVAPPSADWKTDFSCESAPGAGLVHARTSWAGPAASRAAVGWPQGPGAAGLHGAAWLATDQAAPVSGPLSSSPDG